MNVFKIPFMSVSLNWFFSHTFQIFKTIWFSEHADLNIRDYVPSQGLDFPRGILCEVSSVKIGGDCSFR